MTHRLVKDDNTEKCGLWKRRESLASSRICSKEEVSSFVKFSLSLFPIKPKLFAATLFRRRQSTTATHLSRQNHSTFRPGRTAANNPPRSGCGSPTANKKQGELSWCYNTLSLTAKNQEIGMEMGDGAGGIALAIRAHSR